MEEFHRHNVVRDTPTEAVHFSGNGTVPHVLPCDIAGYLEEVVRRTGLPIFMLEHQRHLGDGIEFKSLGLTGPVDRIRFPYMRDTMTYLAIFNPTEASIAAQPGKNISYEKALISFRRPAGMEASTIEEPWRGPTLAYEVIAVEVSDVAVPKDTFHVYQFNGGYDIYLVSVHQLLFSEIGDPAALRACFRLDLPKLEDLDLPPTWRRNATPLDLQRLVQNEPEYRANVFNPAAQAHYGYDTNRDISLPRTDLYPEARWRGALVWNGSFKPVIGSLAKTFLRAFQRADTSGTVTEEV